MLRKLTRFVRAGARPNAILRPQVERLDDRVVPSAATIAGLGGRIIGDNIIVYGTVVDDSPGADQVVATGGVSGSISSTGTFEFIAPFTGNRNVGLSVLDDEGLQSLPYALELLPPAGNQAPYVTFTIAQGPQRTVTITGVVYDESPGSTVVETGGVVPTLQIHPDSSGNFSITLTAASLGTVTARARDAMGLLSNLAERELTNAKPVIEQFSCQRLDTNQYRIRGRVIDEHAPGLVVRLGGEVEAVQGRSVAVGADGWFELIITLADPDDCGLITADVTDWWGADADQATTYLVR